MLQAQVVKEQRTLIRIGQCVCDNVESSNFLKQLNAASCFLHVAWQKAASSRCCVSAGKPAVSREEEGHDEYLLANSLVLVPEFILSWSFLFYYFIKATHGFRTDIKYKIYFLAGQLTCSFALSRHLDQIHIFTCLNSGFSLLAWLAPSLLGSSRGGRPGVGSRGRKHLRCEPGPLEWEDHGSFPVKIGLV